MKAFWTILIFIFIHAVAFGQSNTKTLKDLSAKIFVGEYNPEDYAASTVVDDSRAIVDGLLSNISPDSLRTYLEELQVYANRNSGSDTLSNINGIGAARRYIYDRLQGFSNRNEGRLIVDYLQFDQRICNVDVHRNVIATLPGRMPKAGLIIIEAHMDSRCEDVCDIDCLAEGMEDNGSGTALVMELARVMSKFTFDRSIVFMLTTAEEQGLLGANAMARYMKNLNVDVKAVLNNDVIGGIWCGETSSPPSCPGYNHIDSTQVRIFSAGGSKSRNKSLARYCKLQYQEEVADKVAVPMTITVMSAEDRTGRGGDHIPFREQGYAAIRFTSANEHGDAGVGPDYHDRQHSVRDILGVDTNNDGVVDSFFVDFNYLSRNTLINGLTAAMISSSPEPPEVLLEQVGLSIKVSIIDPYDYLKYKIGIRTSTNDFDTLVFIENTKEFSFDIEPKENFIFVSAVSVDGEGVESCFSPEERLLTSSTVEEVLENYGVTLLQNRPNPFDETTIISWLVNRPIVYDLAYINITGLDGRAIHRQEVRLDIGMNEWEYTHGYLFEGIYNYSLVVDGKVVDSKQMVFAY